MEEKKQPRSIRLDSELSRWVKEQAKAGDRSFNAELVRIVRKAREEAEQKQTTA